MPHACRTPPNEPQSYTNQDAYAAHCPDSLVVNKFVFLISIL